MIRDEAATVEVQRLEAEGSPAPDRAGMAATGGVAGALAATACCILPLVLFSLGAGGVWIGRLASLAPYQPYFIGFAAFAIGYGFRQVYARPRAGCSEDDACTRPLPKRIVKTAPWSATVLTAIALVFPYAIPYFL